MDLRWTWVESWALSQVADLLQLQTSKEPELTFLDTTTTTAIKTTTTETTARHPQKNWRVT